MPYRVTNKAGQEVAIAATYEAATRSVWIPGDTVTLITQEEYAREMAKPYPAPATQEHTAMKAQN